MILKWDNKQKFISSAQLPDQLTKDQLLQIYDSLVVWDGDLISKRQTDYLRDIGFVKRVNGWNFVTHRGIAFITHKDWIK